MSSHAGIDHRSVGGPGVVLVGLLTLAACKDGPGPAETKPPPTEASLVSHQRLSPRPVPTEESETLFVSRGPEETGLAPVVNPDPDHPFAYFYGSGMEAGGVAVGDIDQDGLPDLFLAGAPGGNRLYRQVSPLKFEDMTDRWGLGDDAAWSRGASMADLDNDGDLDIYVANYGQDNYLYINHGPARKGGPLRFVDEAFERRVNVIDACLTASFCDYDLDGDLDFYLITNEYIWPDRSRPPDPKKMIGERDGKPLINPPFDKFFKITDYRRHPSGQGFQVKWDRTGRPDFLLRNDGRGFFEEVTTKAGMQHGNGRGLSATWWDYDDDGFPDLYVGNDWMDRDFLYHNNGDGTFRDVSEDALPHTPMFTMGADAGDLNNDGRIDLLAADMSGTTHYKRKISMGSMQADKIAFMASARPPQNMRNAAYLNTGTRRLFEAAYLLGLANSDWSWAVKIDDYDNDGRADVFVTNGMEQNIREMESAPQEDAGDLRSEHNLAFRNLGELAFAESGAAWGLDYFGFSLAAASADFDRDGDLDLLVVQRDEPPVLHENTSRKPGVLVSLEGRASNRNGLGAMVRLETSSATQIRQVFTCRGYLTSDEPVAHFGLGADHRVERLVVEWPSGHRQSFSDLEVGTHVTVREPAGPPPPYPGGGRPPTLFVDNPGLSGVLHKETPFDDFALQPLLPNKLSQLGPGMATADLNGDGATDVILGGAAGQATQVVFNEGDGRFTPPSPIAGTAPFEDLGLLLLDADTDGDRDLLAISGSVESRGEFLHDRLLLNDGNGQFSPAPPGTLPPADISGGPAAAADIDRDGDLDIFIGGRVVPGNYPIAPASRLLVNDGGVFRDATAERGAVLSRIGLVTAALFADLDDDGWQDLVLAREWGSLAYLHNEGGTFIDKTDSSRLAGWSGWWNGLAAGDLDRDGDLDLVATNFGYNTKYHASADHPALLYYGRFGTDRMRLVEAEYEGETLFPVRGKSCSTQAIPHLAKKFDTFHSFALAELDEIYSPPVLEDATRFAATTLASGVFLNDGKGTFEFRELPRLAQIAPSFGVVVSELDGDGIPDLCLAQNFASAQPETGTMSGGMSLILRGRGDGTFEPLWPRLSGVIVPHDATAACVAALDDDARPDLLVASNNGPLRSFLNRGTDRSPHRGIARVILRGAAGNIDAVGARVVVELPGGRRQTAEVRAGGSYLTHASNSLFFGTEKGQVTSLSVRWPDGRFTTIRSPEARRGAYHVSHPDASPVSDTRRANSSPTSDRDTPSASKTLTPQNP